MIGGSLYSSSIRAFLGSSVAAAHLMLDSITPSACVLFMMAALGYRYGSMSSRQWFPGRVWRVKRLDEILVVSVH